MLFSAGDTFFLKPNNTIPSHLYFLLNDNDYNGDKFIIVNLSSYKDDDHPLYDPSCILNVGDHPFITKKSFICYGKSKAVSSKILIHLYEEKHIELQSPIEDVVLHKIRLGLIRSEKSDPSFVKHIKSILRMSY